MATTDQHEGLFAETLSVPGDEGELIHAYVARPTGPGPYPGMVLFHHLPGWDEWYRYATRQFASRGFVTVTPDLYCRTGHGEPDDVAARVKADGGVADDQVVGDAAGCVAWIRALPVSNGRVGLMGTCSGGRHAYLAGCRLPDVDAVVNCWGGRVVAVEEELTSKQPVAPVDYTPQLTAPLLGIFGEQDHNPAPPQVDQLEQALREEGKSYEFHRYPDAGHGFFYHDRPNAYRPQQALDGWARIWDFLGRTLRP